MRRFIVATAVGVLLLALLLWVLAGRKRESPSDAEPEESQRATTVETLTPEQERELNRIADLGYIAGRSPARRQTGVTIHDPVLAGDGYTLFTYAKGAEAVLIDMEGNVIHRWAVPGADYLARAHLYPNGDLLVLTCDPYRLMRIDRDSDILWTYEKPAHHDFDVRGDGSIWVLTREAVSREDIHEGAWLLDDVLVHLDPSGQELERISLLTAFERSDGYRNWVMDGELPDGIDVLHTNSIEVDDDKRRALVSIRSLNVVAMIDLDQQTVVWGLKGPWHMQHEAQLMDGVLLLFDNLGLRDRSRVIEFNLATGEIVWSYTAPGFLSKGAGAQQRLVNGNTLISESEAGRILEVTRDGEIVWEYVNPRTVEGDGTRTLGITRAVRYPADFPMEWAEAAGSGSNTAEEGD